MVFFPLRVRPKRVVSSGHFKLSVTQKLVTEIKLPR